MNLNLTKLTNIFFVTLFILFSYFTAGFCQDDIYLSLSGSNASRSGIGLADFVPVNGTFEEMETAKDFRDVLENDLILSRHFNVATANTSYKFDMKSHFSYWAQKNVSVILTGEVSVVELTKLIITVKMYDVDSRQLIWEDKYNNTTVNYRIVAHQISDEIVKRFTGEVGIATSKIAFSNNNTKYKEIYVIDYDGYNLRRITKDNGINILPKWVPHTNQIIYTTYLYNNPDLFLVDITKNKRKALSTIQGLNAPTSFAPNGKTMVATLSRGNFPNLYLLDSNGVVLRRLTEGKYIDTSPSFSPSGKEITFISDRAGYPQVYIMDIDGVNLRRLTSKGPCDTPVWSPKGDKIVFTMKADRFYDIFIYDLPKAKLFRLTEAQGNNESPVWSADGRFIAFSSTRSGKSEIYIMGVDGSGIRKLADIPGSSFTPAWSN
ncbi:hypothetical protein [Candidatus Ruminimicrobium bovinum]|uniref:hypothetical protein n=1 Tax=Candidatus Ruminimicrobium bovinum TaxID=3242779 RepID=UPI0039B9CA6F